MTDPNALNEEHLRMVEEPIIEVTAASAPNLFSLITDMYYANDAVNAGEAERERYIIPARLIPNLVEIEGRLEHLSNDDRETLADGDEGEAKEIAGRSPGLTDAYAILNWLFEEGCP